MTTPLLPGPPPAHCAHCGHPVPTGRLYQGYGEKCARQHGILPPRIPTPRAKQSGPDLFDQMGDPVSEPVRPRHGTLTRANGHQIPLVFHPTSDPNVFRGVQASDGQPVRLQRGDSFTVDVLGPGQAVTLDTN